METGIVACEAKIWAPLDSPDWKYHSCDQQGPELALECPTPPAQGALFAGGFSIN